MVGALAGLIWYVKFRPPSVQEVARRCLIAAWQRDFQTLEKYQYPREAQETRVDAATFPTIWREEIEPVYSRFRPLGDITCLTEAAGSEGICAETIETSNGQREEWDMDAWSTDEGPRIALSRFLVAAWTMPYKAGKTEKTWVPADWIAAVHANRLHDADLLHRLGIHEIATLTDDPRTDGMERTGL